MNSFQQSFALASKLHREGDWKQAERYCRQILQADPRHAKALHLLGVIAHQAGRSDLAVDYFTQALRLEPDLIEVHANLGLAFKAQGKLNEAIACFQQALRLKPELAEVHYNVGNALYAQGKLPEATASYQQALRLKPDFALAFYNLGNALNDQGRMREAVVSFHQALRLKPDYLAAHNNLGNVLREQGKPAEAIACYRQVLHLKPDDAETHINLGIALMDQGKRDEAVACYRQALRLDPNSAQAWWHLGQATELDSDDIGRIETELASGHPSRPNRSLLHRTLAVWLDRRQDYPAAFNHLRQANDLMKEELRQTGRDFDPASFRACIDRQIAAFDEIFFQQPRPIASGTELPIFVVGMPRSGTTLVEQILSSHSRIVGAGELHGVAELANNLDEPRLQELANRYLERLTEIAGGASRVIDKMPGNFVHLGLIASLFPQARVVHCRRDPRDVCLSCYFQDLSRINYAYSLHDLGFYYREYERLMAHWRRVLPLRMIEVQYENLVADQEAVSRELIAFCGLEWEDGCLAFHQNPRPVQTISVNQVRQPMYATSIGRWRNYEAIVELIGQNAE